MDGAPKEKKTRRKRRGPGTDKPPRKSFSLRLEQSTFDRMNKMLKAYKGSRNEYIERLIEFDLEYRERIQPLNTTVEPDES
jgi:predicted HicB family RNase H-like nuclease